LGHRSRVVPRRVVLGLPPDHRCRCRPSPRSRDSRPRQNAGDGSCCRVVRPDLSFAGGRGPSACRPCATPVSSGSTLTARIYRLVRRAWQTLWKPVPELINILGVDVPDSPDVSLAEIRADAATVNWTRAPANRPVQKFLIQVNGVVGELGSAIATHRRIG